MNYVGRLLIRQGADRFVVTRVHRVGTRRVVDIEQLKTARAYSPVGVLGGIPPRVGQTVVVAYLQDGWPVVIGAEEPHGRLADEDATERAADAEEDSGEQRSPEDLVIGARGGTEIVLHADGNVTFVLAQGKSCRVQARGGVLRVSENGEASERVVTAETWAPIAETLRQRIKALEGRVGVLVGTQATTMNVPAPYNVGTLWQQGLELANPLSADPGEIDADDIASPSLRVAEPGAASNDG